MRSAAADNVIAKELIHAEINLILLFGLMTLKEMERFISLFIFIFLLFKPERASVTNYFHFLFSKII